MHFAASCINACYLLLICTVFCTSMLLWLHLLTLYIDVLEHWNVLYFQTGLTESDYLAIFHHILMPVAYEVSYH